jgi:hypothetical protein
VPGRAISEYLDHVRKASTETQDEVLKATERRLYRESLYLTTKYLLGYSEINHNAHDEPIRVLESKRKRKLIVDPRGCFKTSVAVVGYAIWSFIRNPNIRVCLDSELFSNSKKTLREISMHLQSDSFINLFGDPRGNGTWNESEILCAQRTSVKKEATFTCSGIGAQKTGQHYDLAILDDMSSPTNTNTEENREKVINHYKYYQSILDPGGEIVVVGTRYHQMDLIGHILANEVFLKDE